MKVVVDTNIIFSALMRSNSKMGEILFSDTRKVQFFAPELLKIETDRYFVKLCNSSKLSPDKISESKSRIFEQINFISEELIKSVKWSEAIELVSDIDEDDTPFVALALELNAFLWTGDKKLIDGLASKNTFFAKSTADIENLILPSL